MMQVAVVGGGSWGTAVGALLAGAGHPTTIWAREPEVVAAINETGENPVFLPGFRLPDRLRADGDAAAATAGAEVVVNAVPTQHVASVFTGLALTGAELVVSLSKGIEVDTLRVPSEILADLVPEPAGTGLVVLHGPSFAREVAAGHPTAVVAASAEPANAHRARDLFSTDAFRVYSSDDVISVELGGALKNVVAIAAGIVDGLGFGSNTQAALITRGLAELTRLGVARGGNPLTFAGLSGMGDLVLTCTGALSRNRAVGLAVGEGRKLNEVIDEMQMVAEGVKTTLAARQLATRLDIDLPITEQVYLVLYEEKDPRRAVLDLMRRTLRDERDPTA